ncbi:carbonic anhydrase [Rhodoferax sp. UBA5149]|uniref:carbonic anhydrase n=1 Tax=Rhodoferax sp. UBA5149 TaxID=1947379 RepID=UPI0025F7ED6C|nr:carbonic anhydrase family protein [Rhodoferax sp. UBA5149]
MKTTRLQPLAHRPLAQGRLPLGGLVHPWVRSWRVWGVFSVLAIALAAGLPTLARAADHAAAAADSPAVAAKKPATPASAAKSVADQLQEAVENGVLVQKRMTLVINGKEKKYITVPAKAEPAPAEAPPKTADGAHGAAPAQAAAHRHTAVNPQASRQYIRAKAAALTGHDVGLDTSTEVEDPQHGGEVHWSYEGANGPQAWGKLKPDFNICALGKRQSPINIDESDTLQGPAEPLQFNYQPSSGSVVNNGHTIQVDLVGDNTLTVRGSTYKLVQFHFHHPSEERVNYQGFAMVAHLVHKNAEGQLAVVSVLLDPGVANALINKVWTHMPLDTGDRVRLPSGLIDMNELLPKDQRYYQFMGSLTTPPCTEGVLWLVLKQPSTVSREQIKLFSQLFPLNARPVQAVNGRPVRDAQ